MLAGVGAVVATPTNTPCWTLLGSGVRPLGPVLTLALVYYDCVQLLCASVYPSVIWGVGMAATVPTIAVRVRHTWHTASTRDTSVVFLKGAGTLPSPHIPAPLRTHQCRDGYELVTSRGAAGPPGSS